MNHLIFSELFRQAAPYIHNYRHKIFVIHFEISLTKESTVKLLHDCAILQSLGIKIILVYGFRQHLDQTLIEENIESVFYNNKRITTSAIIPHVLNTVGRLGLEIESYLSMRNKNSSMQDSSIQVTSGNFITAKPIGVIDGFDYEYTGTIRSINIQKIHDHLDIGEIIIIPSIGFSPIGKIYNLQSEEVAQEIASEIKAEKLIYVTPDIESLIISDTIPRQITPNQVTALNYQCPILLYSKLREAAKACEKSVKRVHFIDQNKDSSFLEEFFTRDGSGIMVTNDAYDAIRKATLDDIPSLRKIMEPLEEKGILVQRSDKDIENLIHSFYVLERDQSIIGCAALFLYLEEKTGELASLAINPEYRKLKKAEFLLEAIEKEAEKSGLKSIFLLTTQTAEWFEDQGFKKASINDLPQKKQQHYNHSRKSIPYLKNLIV